MKRPLDDLHYALALGLVLVSLAGWWAACEASRAHAEADWIRQQYFQYRYGNTNEK